MDRLIQSSSRAIVSAMVLLFGVLSLHAQVKTATLDGADWKKFSESSKVAYASGFMDAAMTFNSDQRAASPSWQGCTADKKGDFHNIVIGQMTDGMDEFYKDYRNQRVHLGLAMLYVRDTITGCSAENLKKELDSIRNSSVSDSN